MLEKQIQMLKIPVPVYYWTCDSPHPLFFTYHYYGVSTKETLIYYYIKKGLTSGLMPVGFLYLPIQNYPNLLEQPTIK